MTTTRMNHTNCDHPANSAARAKCRALNNERAATRANSITAAINSYYDNSATIEEIIYQLGMIDSKLVEGYYDNSLEIEEIISNARRA